MKTRFTQVHQIEKENRDEWNELNAVMNKLADPAWDIYFRYGFEVLGPLLFGFCRWLYKAASDRGIRHLFFLSRDGYLLYNAYKILYPANEIKTSYLYISRKVARQAQIWLNNDLSEVSKLFPENIFLEPKEFFNYFDIAGNRADEIWKDCGLTKDMRFLPKDLIYDERFSFFYRQMRPQIIEGSKNAYDRMMEYLHQNRFYGRVGIVDIGWRGTIQDCLEVILQGDTGSESEVIGFYLGLSLKADNKENKLSFIAPDEEPQEFDAGFVEYPFLAPEGSLLGYSTSSDHTIKPILTDYEYDRENHKIVRSMQDGAMYFVKRAKEFPNERFTWEASFSYANLKRISKHPKLREAKMFGDLAYFDGGKRQIAAPRSIIHYLVHMKDFAYDLSVSGWKIGFLKRLFKVKFDYYKMLKIYKNSK